VLFFAKTPRRDFPRMGRHVRLRGKRPGVCRLQGVAGECPNLFPLEDRYVLIRSTYPISYVVGQFCAANFSFQPGGNPVRTLDYGYGPQSPGPWTRGLYGTTGFQDARGRTVLMGWVSGFQEGRGWNGCASLPRVLTLTDDHQLVQTPLPELADLRDRQAAWQGTLDNQAKTLAGISGDMLEIRARFRAGSAVAVGLNLRPQGRDKGPITIRLADGQLDVAGTRVPGSLSADGTLKLHVFFDRSVLEVFIDDGRKSVTKVVDPPQGERLEVEVFAESGAAEVVSLRAWTLKSIWHGP
jgi:beta-fructofuranosidase